MNTVAVLNRKGGVGKTTIATNLGRAYQLRGLEVILVDTDPQGSAEDWVMTGDVETPDVVVANRPTLHEDIPRLSGYDVAVIDGVAKMERMGTSAVKAADLALIPVRASALSMWTAGELVDLIESRQQATGNPLAAFVLSQAVVGTNLAAKAEKALERFSLPVWPGTYHRVAYPKAIGRGVSVFELGDEKAKEEIRSLTDRTLDALDLPQLND